MKKIIYLTSLLLILSCPVFAQKEDAKDKKSQETSDDTQKNTQAQSQAQAQAVAIEKVTRLAIDCEYDSMCMYEKSESLSKEDSAHPVYKELHNQLKANYKDIEFDHKNCSTDDVKAIKKVLTRCTKEALEGKKVSNNDIQKQTETCIYTDVEKLANDGNIFAQNGMAQLSKDKKNDKDAQKWNQAIEKHKGKPEYEVFQKCKALMNKS